MFARNERICLRTCTTFQIRDWFIKKALLQFTLNFITNHCSYCYYKLLQVLLQIALVQLLQITPKVYYKLLQYYKLPQIFIKNYCNITYYGNFLLKITAVLQITKVLQITALQSPHYFF